MDQVSHFPMYVLADVQQRVGWKIARFGCVGRGHLVHELLFMMRSIWLTGFATGLDLIAVKDIIIIHLESKLGREVQRPRSVVDSCHIVNDERA